MVFSIAHCKACEGDEDALSLPLLREKELGVLSGKEMTLRYVPFHAQRFELFHAVNRNACYTIGISTIIYVNHATLVGTSGRQAVSSLRKNPLEKRQKSQLLSTKQL
jgi:hypothetical protein